MKFGYSSFLASDKAFSGKPTTLLQARRRSRFAGDHRIGADADGQSQGGEAAGNFTNC
ncbi:MAG: hypothetical protein ABSA66_05810 [Roseiarcus sp.]|jgi:hypothetical protein